MVQCDTDFINRVNIMFLNDFFNMKTKNNEIDSEELINV